MYSRTSASELATRVRSLLGATASATLQETSLELGVSEGELREIVQDETRYPSVVVLAALVATHGVDAGWLLTGSYSPATHRATEEADTPPRIAVARLLRGERETRTDAR